VMGNGQEDSCPGIAYIYQKKGNWVAFNGWKDLHIHML
jgi:hypothetical protein